MGDMGTALKVYNGFDLPVNEFTRTIFVSPGMG